MTNAARRARLACWTITPAALLFVLGIGAGHAPTLALVNESPSLPKGLYLRLPDRAIRRGDVVATAQPPLGRDYLASLGMPAEVRLMKRVVAVGGDRVCAEQGVVRSPVGDRAVLHHDSRHRPLAAWQGCRRLTEGEVFLLGDTPTSFDSRYFGPVPTTLVEGIYREAFRW